ncbi:ATP-binding cassette domain-containing protein [Enterococcus sp. HY326]|uniref:ATP-binding cassette domain-containing protein n=1 Tax=Enterococcus sp. HY326 TaxID=2971265 RepID=UPI0022407C55|nr:ATP-binding cassette domain-containing protein [Enterococcus sp. HY326]
MAAIEFKDVSFIMDHSDESFSNLNFSVAPGNFFVLTGLTSAAEKKFVQLLLGLKKPATGQIFLDHFDINQETQRRQAFQKIGVMSQDILQERLTVQENITAIGRFQKNYSKVRQEYLLKKLALAEVRKQRVNALTSFQRQKLAFALALLHNPDIIIVEEPFEGLKDNEIQQLIALFLTEAGQKKTIFMLVEKLTPPLEAASEIAIAHQGRLAVSSSQADIHKTFSTLAEFYDFYTGEEVK